MAAYALQRRPLLSLFCSGTVHGLNLISSTTSFGDVPDANYRLGDVLDTNYDTDIHITDLSEVNTILLRRNVKEKARSGAARDLEKKEKNRTRERFIAVTPPRTPSFEEQKLSVEQTAPRRAKIAVFYSHSCADCRFFRQTWNKLRRHFLPRLESSSKLFLQKSRRNQLRVLEDHDGSSIRMSTRGEQLLSTRAGVDFVAVKDDEYAAAEPFQHFEIPAIFAVTPSGKVLKFSKDKLGDFLEHRVGQHEILLELVQFVAEIQHDHNEVSATTDRESSSSSTGINTNGLKASSSTQRLACGETEEDKAAQSRLLAVLASHPGREIEILNSSGYKGTKVVELLLAHLQQSIESADASSILEKAAEVFDQIKDAALGC
ncbi:unnamed protein product [Amoebophrya sp. A25]|nr:unnamed protein product [Amoebophrya sp. A25]|eukprot:GSA25T00002148001.1